MNSGQNMKN